MNMHVKFDGETPATTKRAHIIFPIPALPFVDQSPNCRRSVYYGSPRDHWAVTPTGDYAADCARGRALADAYLKWLSPRTTDAPSVLAFAMLEMVRKRDSSGLVTGFAQRLGEEFGKLLNLCSWSADAINGATECMDQAQGVLNAITNTIDEGGESTRMPVERLSAAISGACQLLELADKKLGFPSR